MIKTIKYKEQMKLLVECIANNESVDLFCEAHNLSWFKHQAAEVFKLYSSRLFLKMEIPTLLSLDLDRLIDFNNLMTNNVGVISAVESQRTTH